jgi:hypothetical protein
MLGSRRNGVAHGARTLREFRYSSVPQMVMLTFMPTTSDATVSTTTLPKGYVCCTLRDENACRSLRCTENTRGRTVLGGGG